MHVMRANMWCNIQAAKIFDVPEGLPKISDIVIRFSGNSPDNDAGNDDGDDRVEESDVPALEVVSQQHFPKEQKRAGGEGASIFLL